MTSSDNILLKIYSDHLFYSQGPSTPPTLDIKKTKACAIIQDILSKKSPYFLSVSSYINNFSKEYYQTSVIKNSQIVNEIINHSNLQSFDFNIFFQFLMLYGHLNKMYKLDFDPSKCVYFLSEIILSNQYLINPDFNTYSVPNIFNVPTLSSKRLVLSFYETPSHVIDGIAYTNDSLSQYNDRLIYMFAIFQLYKNNRDYALFFIKDLDSGFKFVLERAIKENDFNVVKNNTVLSQYKSFGDFMNFHSLIFKTKSGPNTEKYVIKNISYEPYLFIKHSSIKAEGKEIIALSGSSNKKLDSEKIQSNILLKYCQMINPEIKIDTETTKKNEFYDVKMFEDISSKIIRTGRSDESVDISHSKYYKFPANTKVFFEGLRVYDFQNSLKYSEYQSSISMFYLTLFVNTIKRGNIKVSNTVIEKLNNDDYTLYFLNRCDEVYRSYLKPFYFSYNMMLGSYSSIYKMYVDNFKEVSEYVPVDSIKNIKSYELSSLDYYPPYTLSQFYSLRKLYNRQNDLKNLITKIIFYWADDSVNTSKIINSILEESAHIGEDLDVFSKLRKIHEQNKTNTHFDRGAQRIKDLKMIGFFSLLTINSSFKYLDFGGGNGELTSSIARYLKLNKEQVFVSDVQSWFGTQNVLEYQKNVTLRYITTSFLPFEDESLDLVSAFQVFHHIKNMDTTLKEINRILKVNGILLIREHDCDNNGTRTLIDLDHTIREVCIKDDINIDILHDYDDKYYGVDELSNLIQMYNFTSSSLKYSNPRGPTRYYYKIFKKTSNFIHK
jgi:SAM-dependent methyltransferase